MKERKHASMRIYVSTLSEVRLLCAARGITMTEYQSRALELFKAQYPETAKAVETLMLAARAEEE